MLMIKEVIHVSKLASHHGAAVTERSPFSAAQAMCSIGKKSWLTILLNRLNMRSMKSFS